MTDLGVTYAPGAPTTTPTSEGPSSPGGLRPQEAIRILNLRLPKRASQTSVAPQALLAGAGSAAPGVASGGGLTAILRALAQAFSAPPDPGMAPTAGPSMSGSDRAAATMPSVTPEAPRRFDPRQLSPHIIAGGGGGRQPGVNQDEFSFANPLIGEPPPGRYDVAPVRQGLPVASLFEDTAPGFADTYALERALNGRPSIDRMP